MKYVDRETKTSNLQLEVDKKLHLIRAGHNPFQICLLSAVLLFTYTGKAATLVVTNTVDFSAGSLRQVVAGTAPGDTVIFATNLSGATLSIFGVGLSLNSSVTIDASALPGGISIASGNGLSRVMTVGSSATVVLTALTITNGNDQTGNGGGGINNAGTLTLNRCTVVGNKANNSHTGGGGIFNSSVLTLNQCTLSGNHSDNDFGTGGGAIYNLGTLNVNQSTIATNSADNGGSGGGIYDNGTLTLYNSIVAGNSANGGFAGDINANNGGTCTGNNVVEDYTGSLVGFVIPSSGQQFRPLGNYGGPTLTLPPLSQPPARLACFNAQNFPTDQRGVPRVNGENTDIGSVKLVPPTVLTLAAIVTTNDNNVTLNGQINPNTLATTVWFQWGLTNNPYNNQSTPDAVGNGGTATNYSIVTVQTFGLLYHYRVVASNTDGLTLGNDVTYGVPPVVNLLGPATLTNECHAIFTDPGATGSAGLPVTITGSVNTNAPGTYLLTYTVANSLGTNSVTRNIVVVDSTPPVITMFGANPIYLAVNTPLIDPGAIASDACGGSFAVTTNRVFNTAVPGYYTITYSATDSYGNKASATRLVVNSQPLFADNFDSGINDATNWNINEDPGQDPGLDGATFGYDYSSYGVPPAPNAHGTTIGVLLGADSANPTMNPNPSGVSISPKGRSFNGSFRLTFDMWENFVGDAHGDYNGTTQLTGAGIGTSGDHPEDAGHTSTSLWFAQTGDGGNSAGAKDYRVYSNLATDNTGYATNSGVYAAGISPTAADNFDPYYAALGGNTVPAAQTAIFHEQTGTTYPGAPAFAWHQVTILKLGNIVTYTIDQTLIATVDTSPLTLSGNNIEFIQSDVNATPSTEIRKDLIFGLIDDVSVMTVPPPAFSSFTKTNGIVRFNWNALPNLNYQVQYKTNLTQANWINLGTTINTTNVLTTVIDIPGTDAQRFYRLSVQTP